MTQQYVPYSNPTSRLPVDPQPTSTMRYVRRVEPSRAFESAFDASTTSFNPGLGPVPRMRSKPIRQFDESPYSVNVEKQRSGTRRFDTFGENAIETIYDEFKFLDEPDAPSPSSSSGRPILAPSPPQKFACSEASNNKLGKYRGAKLCASPTQLIYCVLPAVQLLCSTALIVLAVIRTRELSLPEKEPTRLVDFDLPTGSNLFQNGAEKILSLETAVGTISPAFVQAIASIFGFWPLAPARTQRSMQICHVVFSCAAIFLWISTLDEFALEINLDFVRSPPSSTSTEKFILDVVLLCIGYAETILLPALTISVAAFKLSPGAKSNLSKVPAISISLGTGIFAAATLAFAVLAAQGNLSGPSSKWTKLDEELNTSATFAYGLKETLVAVFVFIVAVFSLVVATQTKQRLMLAACVGQGLSILLILAHLVSPARLTSLMINAEVIQNVRQDVSMSELTLILLNGCGLATCVLTCVQLVVFVFAVSLPTHHSPHSIFVGIGSSNNNNNNNNYNNSLEPPGVQRTQF